jgi:hypothetical protein
MRLTALTCLGVGMLITPVPAAEPAGIPEQIAAIKKLKPEGAGNAEAARAWNALLQQGHSALVPILSAMDDDNLRVSNWLRTAVDAICEKTIADGKQLPTAALEQFVADVKNPRAARRLAYEWLTRASPNAATAFLPKMLHDPSPELRRDAVASVLKDAAAALAKSDKDAAKALYQKALSGACDKDQVDDIAKKLAELGAPVDLAAHFGMVRAWRLAAPFDNTDGKGFAVAYPPEKGVDLAATYKGKGDAEVRWVEHSTTDSYGLVDLNKTLGKQKSAVAYAFAAIDSPVERLVHVRLGCINAAKIFVNGQEIFAREEYHHGSKLDQYIAPAKLKAGRNEILVKICQNNQTESWAQDWKFQLRLTDFVGAKVPWTALAANASK